MRIALATCSNLPDWEIDDHAFWKALEHEGIDFDCVVWDKALVNWANYDGVLVRTTWDYQEKIEQFQNWLTKVETQTKVLNPAAVMRWNTEKTYLRDLAELGAPFLDTIWLRAGEHVDLGEVLQAKDWEAGFLKPVVGATARETLRFTTHEAGLKLAQAHLERLLPHESLMLQPYCRSVEAVGEYSALYFGGHFSHGVQKIPLPGDYRVQDDFGASDCPYIFSKSDRESIHQVWLAFERFWGGKVHVTDLAYGRVDLLRTSEGRLVLNELELIEPSLFFRHDPDSPKRLARVIGSSFRGAHVSAAGRGLSESGRLAGI